MERPLVLAAAALAFAGMLGGAHAQEVSGGVDLDGSWYVGEGLEKGDYFYYSMCHVDYKECDPFEMEFWIKGDIRDGSEQKWLVETVVYDGKRTLKGQMHLGKVAPEPTGGSENLLLYRSAFKSSVAWLTSFATSYGGEGGEGPKEFRAPSWGKIGNIGGQQVKPTSVDAVSTRAGTFAESVRVTWYTGGALSQIWLVDDFPFPVKASTWTHVSEGIPPQEYNFELLGYERGVTSDPFGAVQETADPGAHKDCPKSYGLVKHNRPTSDYGYTVNAKYGPEEPKQGCNMEWVINFYSKYDDTEFLNQVQYDILVLDEQGAYTRSLAAEDGDDFLFSPSGQVRRFMLVEEPPGTAQYAIVVYGLAPKNVVPSVAPEFLAIDVEISGSLSGAPEPAQRPAVPAWVKSTAGFWVDGLTADAEFASAISYLVGAGVIDVPPTDAGSGSSEIPSWVKDSTRFWVQGATSDAEFVSSIQFLIRSGVISVG